MTLEELGLEHLSPAERLDLIGILWKSLTDEGVEAAPEWHRDEIARRPRRQPEGVSSP